MADAGVSDDVARKLLATTDATVWADEFMRRVDADVGDVDHMLMVAWFANAIETGRTHGGKMTMERYESLAEVALGSGAPATSRLVAGAFLAAVENFDVDDDTALGNVIALFVGTRGYAPSEQIDERVFKHAAQAAMREIRSEPFEKIERPQTI